MTATTQPAPPRETLSPRPPRRWSALPFPLTYVGRYGLVAVAAAIAATVDITAMTQRGMQWRGDLIWTIDWLAVSFIVMAPVVAGLSAVDTSRLSTGAAHMVRNRVTRTPAFAVFLTYAVLIIAVHVTVLVGALLLSAPTGWGTGWPLAVLCQLLMIACFSALGTLIGRWVRPVVAGALGALAAFALMYVATAPSDGMSPFDFGAATVPRIGFAYDAGHLTWQAACLALITVALLVPRLLEGSGLRRIVPRDAVVVLLLLAVVGAVMVGVRTPRLERVDARPTLCGAVGEITTCFYPQHERVERPFQDRLYALATAAQDKGYAAVVPREVHEARNGRLPQAVDPRVAAFYIMPDHLSGTLPTTWEVASGILQPTHCPQVQGEMPPSETYWKDLEAVTATWVALVDPAEAELHAPPQTPLTPQRAAELADQFRSCTYPDF